ncbi:hypothetical protein GJ496_005382 [Pomphorhynchus laevis]|nr:hypothetical protein GJ496_005382 [Pomphorhynchus laevis]
MTGPESRGDTFHLHNENWLTASLSWSTQHDGICFRCTSWFNRGEWMIRSSKSFVTLTGEPQQLLRFGSFCTCLSDKLDRVGLRERPSEHLRPGRCPGSTRSSKKRIKIYLCRYAVHRNKDLRWQQRLNVVLGQWMVQSPSLLEVVPELQGSLEWL